MKFTVITPVLNGDRYLDHCLRSVANQSLKPAQIIVDGGSTDRTLEIARGYDHVKILMAPGSTIYEALNIGIQNSKTDYICFLNADDYYLNDSTLSVAEEVLSSRHKVDLVYGNCMFVSEYGDHLYTHYPKKNLTFQLAAHRLFAVSHPSCFFRKTIFNKFGNYDESLKYVSDCEFVLRLLRGGACFEYHNTVFSAFRRHKSNSSDKPEAREEWNIICRKHGLRYNRWIQYANLTVDNCFNFRYLFFLFRRKTFRLIRT
jgi:glycosyltransferase involved in cell wall biosynthesis